MEDVAGRGRAVVFVSHNMPSVESLCDRVVLLSDGRIEQDRRVTEPRDAEEECNRHAEQEPAE